MRPCASVHPASSFQLPVQTDLNWVLRSEDKTAGRSVVSGASELIIEDLSHGQNCGGVRAVSSFL